MVQIMMITLSVSEHDYFETEYITIIHIQCSEYQCSNHSQYMFCFELNLVFIAGTKFGANFKVSIVFYHTNSMFCFKIQLSFTC